MNRVVHFEIHAADLDKMTKFYQDCFGWTVEVMGQEYGGYRVLTSGKKEDLGINGGMVLRRGDLPKDGAAVNAYVCIIGVKDIDEILKKVDAAGGTVATEKMDVPGVGLLAYRKDPEGNIFGILQPSPDMQPK